MNQATLLGGLLALSLVGAYLTWTAPEEDANATDVLVVRATAADLSKVTWTEDDKTIVVTQPSDDRGTYLWFEVTERKKATGDDEATPEDEASEEADVEDEGDDEAEAEGDEEAGEDAPTVETTVAFAGNEEATELWKAFAPLYGLRELKVGPDEDLSSYGLDDPEVRIAVVAKGQTTELELGEEAFGTRDRYVQSGDKVYLVDDKKVRPLQFATTRLVERRMHPLAEKDIVSVAVTRGTDARELVQRNADDRTAAFWADATSPEAKDVEAGTWLGKLFRLRVRAYKTPDEVEGTLVPLFSFVTKGRDDAWPVEVFTVQTPTGTEYYARAAFTRSLVELTKSLAEEAVADLDALFDGVVPDEEAEEAPEGDDAPMPALDDQAG